MRAKDKVVLKQEHFFWRGGEEEAKCEVQKKKFTEKKIEFPVKIVCWPNVWGRNYTTHSKFLIRMGTLI